MEVLAVDLEGGNGREEFGRCVWVVVSKGVCMGRMRMLVGRGRMDQCLNVGAPAAPALKFYYLGLTCSYRCSAVLSRLCGKEAVAMRKSASSARVEAVAGEAYWDECSEGVRG